MTDRVIVGPPPRAQDRWQKRAAVSADENATLLAVVARLAHALGELAADLATTRHDCHNKQQRIDSLQADIARLRAAAPAVLSRDDPDTKLHRVRDGVPSPQDGQVRNAQDDGGRDLGAHRREDEYALMRLSSAVLVLRRGTPALRNENASLRLELANLREQKTGRDDAASAGVLRRRGPGQ